jgi:putative two-component system response regulator
MATQVLIVDDEEGVRKFEAHVLQRQGYLCTQAASPSEAREFLKQSDFDLALVDIKMPGESGLNLAEAICSEYPNTATVMVTGEGDPQIANTAIRIGAYGYIVKPFEPNQLLISVDSALHRRKLDIENRAQRAQLEQALRERTEALHQAIDTLGESQRENRWSHEETILRLAKAGECRDDDTGRHVQRMSRYCALLARRLGWDSERCEDIRLASTLHDTGKIGIPDHILHKPDRLTPYEFKIMQQHVDIGYRILHGSKNELIQSAATIAWTHHEKYDGSGYPRKLSGEAISLEGRIAAIADVFDAITSKRVYHPAYPVATALQIMRDGRGKHFDPSVLDTFLASIDEALAIMTQYAD